jgi:hypothetical protein
VFLQRLLAYEKIGLAERETVDRRAHGTGNTAVNTGSTTSSTTSSTTTSADEESPLGFKCRQPYCATDGVLKGTKGTKGAKGVDGAGVPARVPWTCNDMFERSLTSHKRQYRNGGGSTGRSRFASPFVFKAKGYDSTYSRGLANEMVPMFHVLTETNTVPRLHCFHCSSLWGIGAPEVPGGEGGGGNYRYVSGSAHGVVLDVGVST